jgi:hypothetical protein
MVLLNMDQALHWTVKSHVRTAHSRPGEAHWPGATQVERVDGALSRRYTTGSIRDFFSRHRRKHQGYRVFFRRGGRT